MPHRQRHNTAATMILSLAALASACSSPEKTPEATTPKPITAEERVQWYEQCWNQFNDKKWTEFRQCYADNATSRQLGYGKPTLNGADAIITSSQDFAKLSPDGHGEGQLILVNGNHLASVYLLSGTNSGPMTGPEGKEMKATNKKFGLLFGHAVELDPAANKVVNELGVMDGGTFANQLGLSKAPGRPLMAKGAAMPLVVIAKNDEMEMKNLDADKAQWAAWNKHDQAGVDLYVTDDSVFHDTTQPKDMNKAEGSAMNKMFWKAFSDAQLTISSMWAAGDYVAVTGTFEGTNDGDFPAMKLKKTGKKVSEPYLEIDRFEGGKIKEAWLFFDNAMFASQLAPSN